ncbi:MAG: ferritin-like domain-containing protein [Verrucomicrobium sp.]|nr:ferritin-like domain-containing protein [Verrucomicrobium sp.]
MSTHTNYAMRRNQNVGAGEKIKEKATALYEKMTGQDKVTTLEDLFVEQLQDLYSAETQLIEALPKMAEAANNIELRRGFQVHWEETKGHARRLEQILSRMGKSAKGKTCKAMEGLIKEGGEAISENATPEVKDAALIAAAQRVEHYEIAGYGTVRTYAGLLGDGVAQKMLQQTLDEEGATDKKLTAASEKLNVMIPIS